MMAAVARLLLYLGALTVIGDAASRITRTAGDSAPGEEPPASENGLALAGWLGMLVAVCVLLLLQAHDMELDASWASVRLLLAGTTWGRNWSVLSAAIVAGTAARLARAPRAVTTLCALAAALAMSGLGHPAADDDYPLSSRLVDATHVLAMGAWLGGLMLVAQAHRGGRIARWRQFSATATIAAPVVVVSGVLMAWRRLRIVPLDAGAAAPFRIGDAIASDYGRLLLIKLGLVAVVLVLGGMHRRRVLTERAPSWNSIRTELALALVVLSVTGLLTGTAPPGE